MDATFKLTKHREVQVSCEAGCRGRPWMYLQRLLEEMPDINDVLEITLNRYDE